jgi:hypothetical protein
MRYWFIISGVFDAFAVFLLLLGDSPAPYRLDFVMTAAYDSAEVVAVASGAWDGA